MIDLPLSNAASLGSDLLLVGGAGAGVSSTVLTSDGAVVTGGISVEYK